MASRRTDIIVAGLPFTFVVAVGLEPFLLSSSERSALQKRGTKNIKVPRRLKTDASTCVYTKPS